jgi:hypothetical protein
VADTGTVGTDVLPLEVTEATSYSLALDPEDATGTVAEVVLRDEAGAVLLTLTPGSPGATLTLPPGRYGVTIRAGYASADADLEDHRPVFLRPPATPRPRRPARCPAARRRRERTRPRSRRSSARRAARGAT